MATFLTTAGIASRLEDIIKDSKQHLLVVSPYVKMGPQLFERFKSAADRGVSIVFIYGKEDMQEEQKARLGKLKNLKMYFYKELHAKCYMNEASGILCSMNLYDYSEKNNREMGVFFTKTEDEKMYNDVYSEIADIKKSAKQISLPSLFDSVVSLLFEGVSKLASQGQGHCIRCNGKLELNTSKPLCPSCFSSWSRYENKDFQEKYCHKCGNRSATSMARPMCISCFKSNS